MRLIDADDLLAKIQENAPGFMDSGSTITKAFIMAMINMKSVAPTIDEVPVVRCKDCKHYFNGCCYSRVSNRINFTVEVPEDWFCADGERQEGR